MASLFYALFNASWYLARNPDVADSVARGITTAEEHFLTYGRAEGRSPGPLFDPQAYLANNPDVAAAVRAGLITAYDHFTEFGASENREPLALFDMGIYLAQNPDVAAAVDAGLISAVEHFLIFGQREARVINPFIDLGAYLNANPDVAEAVQNGASALGHLLQYGVIEGRDLGNGVDLATFANDPAFQEAIGRGDAQAALERVGALAPFRPGLPPPVTPPAAPPVEEGYTPPPMTFSVIESGTAGSKTLSFSGNATGDITIRVDSPATQLTFFRAGLEAATKPLIAELAAGSIPALTGGDMLIIPGAAFSAIQTKLPADVSFRVTDSNYSLTDASVSLDVLKAMEAATTGFVDASAVTRTFGTVQDAVHVMISAAGTEGDKISVAPGITVMSLSDFTASSADLKAIEEATTGLVSAQGIGQVTGTTADTLHILKTKHGTTGDAIQMAEDVWVVLTDPGDTPEDIDAILSATTGAVTTRLIPGGTYANFAGGDRIFTGLAFQHHTSQPTLGQDGELNWQWNAAEHKLVIEIRNTTVDGSTHETVTYILTGVAQVTEEGGMFTVSAGPPS